MAGPATNVATLGAVNQALGRRNLIVYLGTIIVGSIALAWLFEAMFGNLGQVNALTASHDCGLAHDIAAYALLALLAWFAFESVGEKVKVKRGVAQTGTMTLMSITTLQWMHPSINHKTFGIRRGG